MKHLVAPSILAADFAILGQEIEMVNDSMADWFHVDIMDGIFVPNISFGFPVLEAVARHAKKPLDVHLMITDPDRFIKRFSEAGAANITVHYESCTHLNRTLNAIKDLGCKAGVAINPHTPVQLLNDVLGDVDLVLLMSVNPGFGNQKFIRHTYEKIRTLKALIADCNENVFVEIDGGVSNSNAAALIDAGANVLVAGNTIFSSQNPLQTIQELKNISPEIIQG